MEQVKKPVLILLSIFIFGALICTKITAQTPRIEYSTRLGGSGVSNSNLISVDSAGYVYIAGNTGSSNFPVTANAYDQTYNGDVDIFVTKLSPDGKELVYSTFIGGSGFECVSGFFVDRSGCVYLSGMTESSNFPASTSTAMPAHDQSFFLKLDSTGSKIEYLSRWGGGKILVDSDGNVILCGITSTADFPTTPNAFNRIYSGSDDIYIAKINIDSESLIFSTFLCRSSNNDGFNITLDKQNNIIITGNTESQDFPLKGNSISDFKTGKANGFISKLKSDGSDLLFSTFIGGDVYSRAITDIQDNIYLTGGTLNDLPVNANSLFASNKGDWDSFLFKLSPDANQLIYSTYLGGTVKESKGSMAVDKDGNVFLWGSTMSSNFPVTSNALYKNYQGCAACDPVMDWGDGFFLIMNSNGDQIKYATYIGGSGDDDVTGLAMDKNGDCYLTGATRSSNYPQTNTIGPGGSVFVTKLALNDPTMVREDQTLQTGFVLNQNYPNPFNPSTTINFMIPVVDAPSNVEVPITLKVYDILGREIATLVNGYKSAGNYEVEFDGNGLSSGIYFYQMKTYNQILQKKMLMIK